MKQILILAFVACIAATSFPSCTKNTSTQPTNNPTNPSNPSNPQTPPTIATIPPSNINYGTAACGVRVVTEGSIAISKLRMRYGGTRASVLDKVNLSFSFKDTVTTAKECTFSLKLLARNAKYYVCATALLADNTEVFGNVDSFTTKRGVFTSDTFGGGIVFYVDSTYEHGMSYAFVDQGTNAEWDNGTHTNVTEASGTAIGMGLANTNAIIAANGTGTYAAILCKNYAGGGFHDWCLPSKGELEAIYSSFNSSSSSEYYWSSTQSSSTGAWCEYYNSLVGYHQDTYPKFTTMHVRAVRSF